MSEAAQVALIVPDEESVAEIGANPYDPSRRAAVAAAGGRQGTRIAETIAAMWESTGPAKNEATTL